MGHKNIFKVRGVPSRFCIEVYATACKTTSFENYQQAFYQFVEVNRELVCVPAILVIAPVGIHAAQHSCIDSYLQFMLKCMTGQCGVVYFYVELEIFIEAVVAQETYYSSAIIIVLMFGRLARLGLNKKYTFEPLFAGIVPSHGNKSFQ